MEPNLPELANASQYLNNSMAAWERTDHALAIRCLDIASDFIQRARRHVEKSQESQAGNLLVVDAGDGLCLTLAPDLVSAANLVLQTPGTLLAFKTSMLTYPDGRDALPRRWEIGPDGVEVGKHPDTEQIVLVRRQISGQNVGRIVKRMPPDRFTIVYAHPIVAWEGKDPRRYTARDWRAWGRHFDRERIVAIPRPVTA